MRYSQVPQREGAQPITTTSSFSWRKIALGLTLLVLVLGSGIVIIGQKSKNSVENSNGNIPSNKNNNNNINNDEGDDVPQEEEEEEEEPEDVGEEQNPQEEKEVKETEESTTTTETNEKDNTLLTTLHGQCPNWSETFTARFAKECSYWFDQISKWQEKMTTPKEVAYICTHTTECHGWGDRIGGMESAFFKAIQVGGQFRISHDGLHRLFNPCLLNKKWTNWAEYGNYKGKVGSCIMPSSCPAWLRSVCGQPTSNNAIIAQNTDRTCLSPKQCENMLNEKPLDLSVANTLGCGLRAMFEPSELLYTKMKFPFKIGAEEAKQMSLKEIEHFLSNHFVISIQLRLGDAIAFAGKDGHVSLQREEFQRPFRCVQTLESYLSKGKGTINGKKIVWLLASDTDKIKRLAIEEFPHRIVMINIRPKHVAIRTSHDDLADTIAEWYTLGLGDELVVNKIGGIPGQRDMFHGRVSGFPKTSWAYHLKNIVYDAGRCVSYPLPYEGIWSDLNGKSCGKSDLLKKRASREQPHLDQLVEHNLTFPHAWIVGGSIQVNRHYQEQTEPPEPSPEDEEEKDDENETIVTITSEDGTEEQEQTEKEGEEKEQQSPSKTEKEGEEKEQQPLSKTEKEGEEVEGHFEEDDYHEVGGDDEKNKGIPITTPTNEEIGEEEEKSTTKNVETTDETEEEESKTEKDEEVTLSPEDQAEIEEDLQEEETLAEAEEEQKKDLEEGSDEISEEEEDDG